MTAPWRIPASYYQHFDADHTLDVPAEGYGGWKRATLEFSPAHTAFVCMHAWNCGTAAEFPGWWRAVESMPRMVNICRTVLPRLFTAVRRSGLPLYHVVAGGDYHTSWPGFRMAQELAGTEPEAPRPIAVDPTLEALRNFRRRNVFHGTHNEADIERGFARVDFAPEARPMAHEAIAATSAQLFALCCAHGVNHLIYVGFTINGCILLSPGGMVDMSRHGLLCSTVREATTAIENRETARSELAKELGLWYVGLLFGFVFELEDVVSALERLGGVVSTPTQSAMGRC